MNIRRHGRTDQRGFTLAELLVVIAVIGVIMIGILTLLMTGNQSYLTGANQAEAQAAARAALERVTLDMREAGYGPLTDQNCNPPTPPAFCFNAVTGPGGVGGPTATSFTLQSDWNGSGAIQPGVVVQVPYCVGGPCPPAAFTNVNRGEQITYSLAGGNLQRQESGVDAQAQILITAVQQVARGLDCGGALIANPALFQYCDANGQAVANPGATPEQIRMIVVNMRVGVQNQPPAIWQAGAVSVTMSDRIRLRNRLQ